MFKRKIYDKMLQWKNESGGNTALLVEGARRIGNRQSLRSLQRTNMKAIYLLILLQRRKRSESFLTMFPILIIFFAASATVQEGSARTKVGYHI